MATTEIDARTVLEAVREIVPRLRENGQETERRRWLVEENIELLEQAGAFRAAVPVKFGGLDLPLADQAEIIAEIARGCGSTGWVSTVWISSAWIVSLYPDAAQEEVFKDGSVRVSGVFTAGGTLTPVEGGYRLNGSWRFNTGVRGAQWNIHAARLEGGSEHDELYALVPVEELEILDDWDVFAAAGTGSSTSVARDVFVPAHRVVGLEVLDASTKGRWNYELKGRNYGVTTYVLATCVPAFIGLAKAALETLVERIPGKAVPYTRHADQSLLQVTQLRVATAANRITAAEALSKVWLQVIQDRADAGVQPTVEEKATIRGQVGYAVQTTKEAVEELYSIAGASTIARSVAFQRVFRDIEGLSLHGLMTPIGNLEVHGRVLLGLDPDTDYL